jgi:GNAT superfamily N-acetyltransferase
MITLHRIQEILAEGNLWDFIQKRYIFWNRVATPVEMDLTTLPASNFSQYADYKFIELILTDLQAAQWHIPISSRRFRGSDFLKKGWRGFAIIKDSTVVGDVWCANFRQGLAKTNPPDLKMLGIRCGEWEAYAFDMFIYPTYRGKNLAVLLHRYLHLTLKNEGYQKVYGYYWDDNLPALWMHKMVKFTELPKRRVSRFFFFQQARYLDQTAPYFQDPLNRILKKTRQKKL